MRKFKYIILSMGLFALMLNSCNKERQNQIVQNSDGKVYWTAEDLRIQNNILNFQNKINNNTFKNGETISLDSAVWYLEALLNYNYSTPDSSFVNLTVDTTFEFNLPVNNDFVNYENVADVAFAMEEHVVDFLNNMPNSIKFIISADVRIKPSSFKSGSSTISITTGYGSEYIANTSCYPPFEENDYWAWGFDLGGCGANSATNSDAAEEIEYKINNPQCIQQGYPGTYIAENLPIDVWAWDYPNPNDDTPGDNWLDCLLYYEDDYIYPIDGCLEPTEMNFYLQGTLDVVQTELANIQNQHPNENWCFLYIDLHGELIDGGQNYPDSYLHWGTITFGKRVVAVSPRE